MKPETIEKGGSDPNLSLMLNAKSYALRLLAIRPRSIKELKAKLVLKGYPSEEIDKLIEEFKEKRFLDDLEFARAFLRSRMAHNPKGIALLKAELRQKGIDEEVIEESIGELGQIYDQGSIALELARSRKRRLCNIDEEKSKKRIHDFLVRRGFPTHTIYKVIKEVWKNSDEDNID